MHIEYEYLGKYGDCVDLNTSSDTLYCYPKDCDFSVTKLALATEELYDHYWKVKEITAADYHRKVEEEDYNAIHNYSS